MWKWKWKLVQLVMVLVLVLRANAKLTPRFHCYVHVVCRIDELLDRWIAEYSRSLNTQDDRVE